MSAADDLLAAVVALTSAAELMTDAELSDDALRLASVARDLWTVVDDAGGVLG